MSDVELIYDGLYAVMVTTPAPEPFPPFPAWPSSVFAVLCPDSVNRTQELPIITGKSLLGNG